MKMMSPNTTIHWITAATYDPLAPKATLFTDATNISCAIDQGYKLNPTDSKSVKDTNICMDNNGVLLTSYAYEASLTMFRDADLEATLTAYAKAWAFFKHKTGESGWLVRRVGKRSTLPIVVGDELSSFYVQADDPQDIVEEDDFIKFTVEFGAQGRMELFKTAVA